MYAHTPNDYGEWHDLKEHLEGAANRAREFAAPFGAGDLAQWLGALHDVGKINPRFQEYRQELATGDSLLHDVCTGAQEGRAVRTCDIQTGE